VVHLANISAASAGGFTGMRERRRASVTPRPTTWWRAPTARRSPCRKSSSPQDYVPDHPDVSPCPGEERRASTRPSEMVALRRSRLLVSRP